MPPSDRSDAVVAGKHELRSRVRDSRRARSDEDRRSAAEGIADRLDDLVAARGARTIACYLSLPSEPGTRAFLARRTDLRVILPATRPDGLLDWVEAEPGLPETIGVLGVPEPDGFRHPPSALGEADLVLIPAAAVDEHGMRLGWGRGYYDRTIDALRTEAPVWAIVFDPEVVTSVPREPHDRPVDGIVTPTRLLPVAPPTTH